MEYGYDGETEFEIVAREPATAETTQAIGGTVLANEVEDADAVSAGISYAGEIPAALPKRSAPKAIDRFMITKPA
ncbi:MAG: hypothetical protein AAB436_03930 [Patescibacteria group bacterium]